MEIAALVYYGVFYSTDPAGFVNITVENDAVTSMEVNQDALDAYIASLPDPEPVEPTEPEPTSEQILNTLLGVK